MKRIITVFLAVVFIKTSFGQCLTSPVGLVDRINNSSLIVEGRVVSQKSFWNEKHNYIYTSNLIEIYKIFKGVSMQSQLEIITEGGELDMVMQKVEPSLQLSEGDAGVFTLNKSTLNSQFSKPTYLTYADAQGFIRYDLITQSATDIFNKYPSITGDLFPLIEQTTGNLHQEVTPFPSGSSQKVIGSNSTAAITGISPTTITAGTFSVLTITGSGFGATQGTSIVEFRNADDGGSTFIQPHSTQYVSWSNTQIQVMVPTRAGTLSGTAGTGQVRVTVAGSPTLSAQTLTISYGHLNAAYTGTVVPVQIRNTRHVSLNGAGGITWRMYTGFDANASAKASFLRAFQTWRCATYINWVMGATTSLNTIASDGTNIVRFDVGSELPAGVLGRCTSYWSGCFTGTVVNYYVAELDIVFDDGTNWQYGPTLATGTQYDFESVAVHELGHGHQLSHVINSVDVMHYSIANAQNKRSLNVDDINGGTAVMTRNLSGVICGQTIMTALNSTNCALAAPTASFNVTSPVCVGQTVPLTDLSSGSPTNWTWTMAGGSPSTSTLQNTSTTYSTPGTYSITLIAANGTGTSTPLTKTISVLATPTINIAGTNTVCSGSTRSFTATGATSYTWNPGTLTGSVVTVGPTSTTSYTVTGSNGACSSTAAITLSVTTTPTIVVTSATVCAGNSATLFATGAGSYTWNPGGTTGTSQTFTPAATTIYTVTGANGLCTTTRTTNIIVNPTPTVNITGTATVCAGSSRTLTASGATTYTWMPGSITGSVAVVSPTTTTIYTVTGTNANNCTNTKTFTLTVSPSPTLTVGTATICPGAAANLTVTGGSTYTWNPGGLTGSSVVFTPATSTVYTVTGSNGSCSSTKTTAITVNPKPIITVNNPSVCAGQNINLTSNGGVSYSWSGPSGFSSSVQNPTINNAGTSNSGQYTVVVTSAQGCTNSAVANVTVNASPSLLVSSNSPVCSGSTLSFFANSSVGASFLWGGPVGFTSTVQNPSIINVTSAAAGMYTVTATLGGCSTTTTLFASVIPSPTIAANNATICPGNSATLTASGATNYTWNPGALTGSVQVVSPSAFTIYTITGTSGTCSNTRTVSVSVVTGTAVASSNSPVCVGSTILLFSNGGSTFAWAGPNSFMSTSQFPTIPNAQMSHTGVYTVSATVSGCTFTAATNVTVVPLPVVSVVASSTNICVGQSSTLTASGATNYTFNPGNSTVNPAVVSPTLNTSYTVTGMASSGCSNTAVMTISVSPCTAIETVNNSEIFVVYPNPSQGMVTVKFGEVYTGKILVYNVIGQELINKEIYKSEMTTLDLSPFAKGIYILKLKSDHGTEKTIRVLKD
jgi:PKD repeat protein